MTVAPADRTEVVAALAAGGNRSLIFTRTKHGARKLARQLTAAHIPAAELHGNLTQATRERNLASFASGTVRVMVATDIAARGIHVDGIDLVIHADPPAEHKAYLHRSGWTGRAAMELRPGLKDAQRPAALMYAQIVLSLLAGVRTKEAGALRWDHVDLDGDPHVGPPVPLIWPCGDRCARGETKTERSRRTLALPGWRWRRSGFC